MPERFDRIIRNGAVYDGMPWVLVNGEPVVRHGEHTGTAPGRPVRFTQR